MAFPYRDSPQSGRRPTLATSRPEKPGRRVRDVSLLWMFLGIALVPLVGLLVIGTWNQDELGVAAAIAVAALVGLAHEYGLERRRRAS